MSMDAHSSRVDSIPNPSPSQPSLLVFSGLSLSLNNILDLSFRSFIWCDANKCGMGDVSDN